MDLHRELTETYEGLDIAEQLLAEKDIRREET